MNVLIPVKNNALKKKKKKFVGITCVRHALVASICRAATGFRMPTRRDYLLCPLVYKFGARSVRRKRNTSNKYKVLEGGPFKRITLTHIDNDGSRVRSYNNAP